MLLRHRINSLLVLITIGSFFALTSCGQDSSSSTSIDRVGSTDDVQNALRERAYALWDAKFPKGDVIVELNVSEDTQLNSTKPSSTAKSTKVVSAAEEKAWRAEQAALLEDTPTEQLGIMCQLFFESLMTPQSDDSFAAQFIKIRTEFESQGLSLYSADQVELYQDNRLTMPYPSEGKPSFMIMCKGDILFKKSGGGFEKGQAFISWAYVLRNGKAEFSFPWLTWNILK